MLGTGEIRYPQPVCVTQLDGNREHFVKRDEEWDLDQHWQTAAHGIGAVLLVEAHHLFVLLLLARVAHADALVLFVDRGDLRLQRLHLLHRLQVRKLQREQKNIDEDRDNHDGPSVIVYPLIVDVVQRKKQRFGQEREPAEIHDVDQLGIETGQNIDVLWSHK